MKPLTERDAKEFALENFKKLSRLEKEWMKIHSEEIIEILKIFPRTKDLDREKFFALAWIHDIGYIISQEGHAKHSLEILEKEFILDEIDKDCILNHGTSGIPKTKEGKLFRYSDGLSLFTKKSVQFRFYAEAKEGFKFEEIKERLKQIYEKYKERYSDSEEVIELLDRLYRENIDE